MGLILFTVIWVLYLSVPFLMSFRVCPVSFLTFCTRFISGEFCLCPGKPLFCLLIWVILAQKHFDIWCLLLVFDIFVITYLCLLFLFVKCCKEKKTKQTTYKYVLKISGDKKLNNICEYGFRLLWVIKLLIGNWCSATGVVRIYILLYDYYYYKAPKRYRFGMFFLRNLKVIRSVVSLIDHTC